MPECTNFGFVEDDKLSSGDYAKLDASMSRNAKLYSEQEYGQDSRNIYRSRTAYVTIGVLCLINLINYMDRFTIAGVLEQVQEYYSLNNEEAGLLQTAFVISYMVMAPIFGYLGDRYNRKYLVIFGVLFWSCTTLLGSLVPENYFGIFIALRALVGIGEASYSTVAPTIIADLFTKKRRSQMLAIFYFAIPLGSGLGYIIGSQITLFTGDWKWSLRVTPVIGLISVILAVFFLREPPRGQSEGSSNLHTTSLLSDLKALSRTQSYLWSTFGFTCVAFATGALAWWAPKYMQLASDVHHHEPEISEGIDSSFIFGIITCVAGIGGVLLGSLSSQYYTPKNPRADPLICAIGLLTSIPLLFASLVIADRYLTLSWVLIFFGEIFLCVNWTLVADMLLYVVIPTRRALAQSFQILISHTLGDAISPYICGKVADAIMENSDSKFKQFIGHQYSLYIPIVALVFGGLFFFITAFHIERDRANCNSVTHSNDKVTEGHSENYDSLNHNDTTGSGRHRTNHDSKQIEITKM